MERKSIQDIQSRWLETQRHAMSLPSLQKEVRYNGPASPCVAGCRSVCWKAFLLFQSDFGNGWSHALAEHRAAYSSLREHFLKFIKHPEELNLVTVDPLADDPASPWNTVRQDELIRQEILQDVSRLPEEPFYHHQHIQTLILDILFIYCKLNPDTGYRQGMHELLAPLVYAVYQDAVDASSAKAEPGVDFLMVDILDSSYVEHDSYALFARLMDNCKPFYETESQPNSSKSLSANQSQISSIVEKSRHIHEGCLSRVDPELASHLTEIDVLPQIFLIRWIRLLFGREFPFKKLLILWDTIFALDPTLQLVDFICVAMLLRVRWELLEADYPGALQLLLKYPLPKEPHGPHTFVEDALYISTHMTPSGGSNIIQKYTGKVPSPKHGALALPTPVGLLSSTPFRPGVGNLARARTPLRSPLPSPGRLFGQQDEMRALFSGAAKNVLQQSEKLGINRAIRDTVGDIRRGWSEAKGQAGMARPSTIVATSALAAMERRNRQLALMLDEAFGDLKALSDEDKGDKDAIEMVAAKVHFVKVHLEDSTLVLEDEEPKQKLTSAAAVEALDSPASKTMVLPSPTMPAAPETPPSSPPNQVKQENLDEVTAGVSGMEIDDLPATKPLSPVPEVEIRVSSVVGEPPVRPLVLPIRPTLANSSFSFMLEDPNSSKHVSETSSSPSSITSSPSKSHKRGTSVTAASSRERNAFLFGEVVTPIDGIDGKDVVGSGDVFGLLPIKKGGKRVVEPAS